MKSFRVKEFLLSIIGRAKEQEVGQIAAQEPEQEQEEHSILEQEQPCSIYYSKRKTLSEISQRLEKIVQKQKLYLDPNMSLTKLSTIVGSNRTYISNIMAEKNGFRNYINSYRLEYFNKLLNNCYSKDNALNDGGGESGGKPESYHLQSKEDDGILADNPMPVLSSKQITILALQSGFSDLRTFKRFVFSSESECAKIIRQRIYSPLQEPEEEQIPQLYRKG